MTQTLRIASDAETLQADLYGEIHESGRRAVILVHGQNWDASGWRTIADQFWARHIPALALNLRGYDGSTGKTDEWAPPKPWSPVADLRAAKQLLRTMGAREVALVGASMGGHAVLASSFEDDVECVVSVSAPVVETPDELVRKVSGRKLFVCADDDASGAWPHVARAFHAARSPKKLVAFGGKEHSRGMFAAPYGAEAVRAIVDFVAETI